MRIVIKVGTSTLAHASTGQLNIRQLEQLCKVLSDIKNAGHEVILVSSGAISMGMGKLGLKERPETLPGKQAAAAVGQCELMYTYDRIFAEYNHTVAQMLLTASDINDTTRKENFVNTMENLLERRVLPIINENDTVATEQIIIGDNDTLGALVAKAIRAKLYVILSDIDGMYTADPHKDPKATLIPLVQVITPGLKAGAGDTLNNLGTGGMITKVEAAEIVTAAGCDMIITNGRDPFALYDIVEGRPIGTKFVGRKHV